MNIYFKHFAFILFFSFFINVSGQGGEEFLNSGIKKSNAGDYSGSVADYTKYIAICQSLKDGANEAKGHWMRGIAYKQLGDYLKATDDFLQGFPYKHDDEFYVNMVECYYKLKDYGSLTEMLQKGMQASENPDTRGKLFKYSGLSLYDSGQKQDGCDAFKASKEKGNLEGGNLFKEYCQCDPNSVYFDKIVYADYIAKNSKQIVDFERLEDGTLYKGSLVNGKKNGTGTWKRSDGSMYTGAFSENQPNGFGTYTFSNGSTYTGNFVNGFREGKGKMVFTNGSSYDGEWKNDQINGQGVYNMSNVGKFTGTFVNNEPNGNFIINYDNGDIYQGTLKGWAKNGRGIATFASGDQYTGDYVNDQFQGQGKYVSSEGWMYEGSFISNNFNGKGKMVMADGHSWYEGDFANGKFEGQGVLQELNGYYKGSFKAGKRHGKGIQYDNNGKVVKDGTWNEGTFLN